MPSTRRPSRKANQQASVGGFALLMAIVVVIIGILGLVGLPDSSDDTGILMRIVLTVLAGGVLMSTLRIARVSLQHQRWFAMAVSGLLIVSIIGVMLTSHPIFGQVVSFLWVLLVITAPVLVLRQVLAADNVTVQTILGAITVYLLIGVSLALVAIAMQQSVGFFEEVPRSTAYVYFAFVTITTIGYGDLSPYTDGARMVSVGFAVAAQMYLVIVVARLVTIWRPQTTKPDSGGSQ
ncbi:MAG: ion channel [Actinomycetia bacterium]|nr:ion channel [Actinomycetes bacterium]